MKILDGEPGYPLLARLMSGLMSGLMSIPALNSEGGFEAANNILTILHNFYSLMWARLGRGCAN